MAVRVRDCLATRNPTWESWDIPIGPSFLPVAVSRQRIATKIILLVTIMDQRIDGLRVFAPPLSGGMGTALLRKMGWRSGEKLGINEEGTLEPLQLEVELDNRGHVSEQDIRPKVGKATKPLVPVIKLLQGKHPVSLLGEYCSKRKLHAPIYELCFECGPDHNKSFLFKVTLNEVEYKPCVVSSNKKTAKAIAAQTCLQTLGILPNPDSKTVKKP